MCFTASHQLLRRGMGLHVERVATDMNIADLPTRGHLSVLRRMGALEMAPVLSNPYREEQAWHVLRERWTL